MQRYMLIPFIIKFIGFIISSFSILFFQVIFNSQVLDISILNYMSIFQDLINYFLNLQNEFNIFYTFFNYLSQIFIIPYLLFHYLFILLSNIFSLNHISCYDPNPNFFNNKNSQGLSINTDRNHPGLRIQTNAETLGLSQDFIDKDVLNNLGLLRRENPLDIIQKELTNLNNRIPISSENENQIKQVINNIVFQDSLTNIPFEERPSHILKNHVGSSYQENARFLINYPTVNDLILSFEHLSRNMIKEPTINGSISLAYLKLMNDLFRNHFPNYFGGIYEKFHHSSIFELDFYNRLIEYLNSNNLHYTHILNDLDKLLNIVHLNLFHNNINEYLLTFKYFNIYINHATGHSFPTHVPLDNAQNIPLIEVLGNMIEISNNAIIIKLFEIF